MADPVSRDTSDEEMEDFFLNQHQQQAKEEDEELAKVLASKDGRSVLFRILAKTGIYTAPPDGLEPMARWAGRRDVGLEILSELLTVSPTVYILMQQEADAKMRIAEQRVREKVKEQNDVE